MSKFHSYLNTAEKLVLGYKGEEPLSAYLKKFFSLHKKYGSKDRKQIGQLCYSFFRLGKSLSDLPIQERLLVGLFLSQQQPSPLLMELKPAWNEHINDPLFDKLDSIKNLPVSNFVFPWPNALSEGVNPIAFTESFFQQPDLFVRVRPGNESRAALLIERGAKRLSNDCFSLPNSTKLDEFLQIDREIVIQDYSSQQIGEMIRKAGENLHGKIRLWDCCAASGGKSILARDILGNIDLTVSDIRESILANLRKRFERAGIRDYNSFVKDLSIEGKKVQQQYQFVVCDAPCSGSGTWSRTPEELYFFEEKEIGQYSSLQKKIVSSAIPSVVAGGYFLYITCSVFREENETMVDFILDRFKLKLVEKKIYTGYQLKADTMFAALFTA